MREKRQRIVVIGGAWTESGGISNRTRLFARELAARGWDVRIIGRAGTRTSFLRYREPGIRVVDVPGFERPLLGAPVFVFVALISMLTWARGAKAILCFQLSSPLVAASIGSFITGAPVLAATTTSGEFSEVAYLERSRLAVPRVWFARRAAWLLGQTDTASAELRRIAPHSRVATLPTPVEVPETTVPLPNEDRVAYVGRLSEEKHLLELLDSWEQIVRHRPRATLILVGEGGSYRSVEAALHARVADSADLRRTVRLTGHVSAVRGYLQSIDVFVLPSRTEGMSNALLEAAAEGRAIVASRIPGNVAVLGEDYPFYVEPGDVDAMAEIILRLLDNRELAAHSAHLARFAAESHSVAEVTDRLLRLIADDRRKVSRGID